MNVERPERKVRFPRTEKPRVPAEWHAYLDWLRGLPPRALIRASIEGVWPEGTPQHFTDLYSNILPEEGLMWGIFGDYPPIEEILSRTPEDMQRLESERGEPRLGRLALALGGSGAVFPMPDIHSLLERPFSVLADRERVVVRQRLGLDDGRSKTQAEVAKTIGCSIRTIRRIEQGAFRKLRGLTLSDPDGQ